MKKLLLTYVGFSVTVFLALSATYKKSSSGAPPSHTGAPGENTCAVSGCHDDNRINSGTASLSISLENEPLNIEPGKTYTVKVKITDQNVSRFGFQIVALESETLNNAGTFQITDSLRTQIVQNSYKLKERNYVTYTYHGTDTAHVNTGEWLVKWTAPSSLTKPVTFYASGVSANDDMSDKGDKVYTTSLTYNETSDEK